MSLKLALISAVALSSSPQIGASSPNVQIKTDAAAIAFGVNADAVIQRTSAKNLTVSDHLHVTGDLSVKGDLQVDGDIIFQGQSVGALLANLATAPANRTYSSCSDMYFAFQGNIADGVYTVHVLGQEIEVYCDMKNGGWTRVINVLSTTPQNDYVDEDAVNDGETASTEMYKLSDAVINEMAALAGKKDFLYICGDEVEFVSRTTNDGNWTSLRNQGGYIIDRDVDGRYDCTADRQNYIFADYIVSGYSGAPLHDDEDCTTGIHTDFGEGSTNTGCYMANGNGWAEPASVWVGGQFAVNRAISNCATDTYSCEYSTHFDRLYDEITRR